MKRSLLLGSLLVLALAGCTRTIVRDHVVEKQPIVERDTVVQPSVTREAIVTAPAACTLGSLAYSSGSLSCQAGLEYQCTNGTWARVPGTAC